MLIIRFQSILAGHSQALLSLLQLQGVPEVQVFQGDQWGQLCLQRLFHLGIPAQQFSLSCWEWFIN